MILSHNHTGTGNEVFNINVNSTNHLKVTKCTSCK